MVTNEKGNALTSVSTIKKGTVISVMMRDGVADAEIKEVRKYDRD